MAASTGLNLDTVELRGHGTSLSTLADSLGSVQGRADDIKAAFGHSGVTHEVVEVSSQWDDRRRGMVEAMRDLAGAFELVAESFETSDEDLAAACSAEE